MNAGPQAVLSALYEGGVRSLLLDGGLSLAAPFLGVGSVDMINVYVVDVAASGRPEVVDEGDWWLVPAGFRLDRVGKVGRVVVVDAVHEPGEPGGAAS